MATTKELNVRLGFLFDDKGLRGIERRMRAAGNQLSRIGTDLSLSLSAPLLAFGAATVKAGGDIESLTLALKSQTGSAAGAQKELELLTEAAKNPGLGLEQAVKGSVRLQGVKFSAEEARQVLVQMGNSIASTGGTAQELDAVTRQFAQMSSKGRVLQEDVSVLAENMPAIAGLMQKAFGTASVEAIRQMGISGKDFVLRITEAAKELPRVEGGIKNGIGNAMDSLKQSAAKVGLAINNAFNVTGAIEAVSDVVLGLASAFTSLSPVTQKVIIGLAGVAVATGPVLKGYGTLKLFASELIGTWRGLISGIGSAITAFKALDTAMKATVIGVVITAVGALALAYQHYTGSMTDAQRVKQSLDNVERTAAASIAQQKTEVETLISAYKTEGATLEQKREILGKLNKIAPEYFGQIKAGKGDIEKITIATAAYTAELLKMAKITALKDRLVEIEKALLDFKESAEPTFIQTAENYILSMGNASGFAAKQIQTVGENIKKKNEQYIAEKKAITDSIIAEEASLKSKSKISSSYDSVGVASKKASSQVMASSEAIKKDVQDTVVALSAFSKIQELPLLSNKESQPVIQENAQGPSADLSGVEKYIEYSAKLNAINLQFQEGVIGVNQALSQVGEQAALSGGVIQNVFLGVAQAVSNAAASGASSFKELASAAVASAAKVIRAWIQQGVASAVSKALSSLPFPANIAAGAIAGGAAAALFTKAIGAIGVKGFAKGTNYAPGGLALVGEQGPELINLPRASKVFPTPRTNAMLNDMAANNAGRVEVSGQFRVAGTDLVLILERTNSREGRVRGF